MQRRKSCTDYELKHARYVKEKAKFLATLQEETSNGREMVCAKYQITSKALAALVEQLGGASSAAVLSKSHIEDLIWEVNDQLDGMISFEEFEKSYMRARSDRTGLEPSELFFLIGFVMFDKERSGRVSSMTSTAGLWICGKENGWLTVALRGHQQRRSCWTTR